MFSLCAGRCGAFVFLCVSATRRVVGVTGGVTTVREDRKVFQELIKNTNAHTKVMDPHDVDVQFTNSGLSAKEAEPITKVMPFILVGKL